MFVINATDYAPIDPLTPPCDVNQINIGYVGENHARCLVFDLTECVAQFGEGGFAISFIRHGDYLPYLVTDTDRLENNAIWIINSTDTAVEGYGMVQLQYIVGTTVVKSALYQTVTFASNEIPGNVPDPYEDLLTQIAAYAAAAEAAATTATAAAMTDSSKVYVYTGSEAGYINGNWYYYNGTEWVSGGVYQATAVNTDKTLTVSDMAADAAVVGDRIDECMAAFVTEQTSGSIASFDDGADNVPVKGMTVNITAVQTGMGDPSPSNVRAILGYDMANIGVADTDWMLSATIVANQYYNDLGVINGSSAQTTDRIDNYIPVSPDKKCTLRLVGVIRSAKIRIHEYDINMEWIRQVYISDSLIVGKNYQYSWFPSSDAAYIRISYPKATTVCLYTDSVIYPISFSSAGTVYGGTLDVTTGMLTVTHGSCTISDRSWNYDATYTRFTGAIPGMVAGKYAVRKVPFMCSAFLPIDDGRAIGNVPDNAIYGSGTSQAVYIKTTNYTTVSDFVNAVGNERIVYEFANPISYQLSPTEVSTILGQNNIWSDTGDITNLEYRADTRLYIEHLTNPDGDMVADANIANGSYFMVNNRLYIATAAIASGASIVPGTNCTETNLAAALNAINA